MPRKKPSQPPTEETSSEKVDVESLKALNVVLVGEAMETREKMNNLRARIAELSVDLDHSLRAGVDQTVALMVLESEAEEKRKQRCKLERRLKEMEAVWNGLQTKLREAEDVAGSLKESEGRLAGEVKRLEVEIELARKEEEGKSSKANDLERKNAELLDEIRRFNVDVAGLAADEGTKEMHFEVVKEELIGRRVELQKELDVVLGERDELMSKNDELCCDIGYLKTKEKRVKEVERMNEDLKAAVAKLRAEIDAHGEETGERETNFEVARMMLVGKVGVLERKVEELTKENEGIWKKNEKLQGEMGSWRNKDETNSLRISELKREKQELSDILELSKGAAEMIAMTVAELQGKNAEYQTEIRWLKMEIDSLHQESHRIERGFDLRAGHVVAELKEKVKELAKEKGDIHGENGKLFDELTLLKKENEARQKALDQLEATNKELAESVQKLAAELENKWEEEEEEEEEEERLSVAAERKAMELVEDRVRMETRNAALHEEIARLNLELNKHAWERTKRETSFRIAAEELEQGIRELRRQVDVETNDRDGAEKKSQELRNEIEKLRVELKDQIEEKEEKERGFEASSDELAQEVEELKRKMQAATAEKEGLRQAKAERKAEIRLLAEEIEQLSSSTIPRLHKTAADQAEEINALRGTRAELQTAVDKQKMLRKRMKEMQKGRDCANQVARRLEDEKAEAEDVLTAVRRELQETEGKARTAASLYPRALAMMKSSAKAMRGGGGSGAVDDQPKRRMEDRDLQPFACELESVRRSFKKKGEAVEAVAREVRALQTVVEAAKTRMSVWVLTASVTSAVAVLALAACAANLSHQVRALVTAFSG